MTSRPVRSTAEARQRQVRRRASMVDDAASVAGIGAGVLDPTTGLPVAQRARLEQFSGFDMGDVRVHYRSPEPAKIRARAFARGTDIHLGPGEERHLPHEAWHVAQQKQGRVAPGVNLAKGPVANLDPSLEREADRMGATLASSVASAAPDAPGLQQPALRRRRPPRARVVQGVWVNTPAHVAADPHQQNLVSFYADVGQWTRAFRAAVETDPEMLVELGHLERLTEDGRLPSDGVEAVLSDTYRSSVQFSPQDIIDLLDDLDTAIDDDLSDSEMDLEMEELIEQFSAMSISVPFRIAGDLRQEDHTVSVESGRSDVIVASNPKPLKLVLAAKQWEGYPLPPPTLAQLSKLRKSAKLKLYRIAGNAKRGIKGSRSGVNMKALRAALELISNVLANLGGAATAAAVLPPTVLGGTDANQDSPPVEGRLVQANPLSINSAAPGSKPHDGRLMKAIRKRAGDERKSYVQMHLLNDLVFGPGQLWNLTPGPKQSNTDMERHVEDPLKRAVLGKGLVIQFQAKVKYLQDPNGASDQDVDHNPDRYRFDRIDFAAKQLVRNPLHGTWGVANAQDPDVKKVDKARVNWRYGGLTPLTPKPKIGETTDWKHLVAVGIRPGTAKRIAAFVAANGPWQPFGGSDKKDQLANAVKAWDRMRTKPIMTGWKAGDVYW